MRKELVEVWSDKELIDGSEETSWMLGSEVKVKDDDQHVATKLQNE